MEREARALLRALWQAVRRLVDRRFFGGLAQLGERLAGSQEVRGSNPLSSIYLHPLALQRFTASEDKGF